MLRIQKKSYWMIFCIHVFIETTDPSGKFYSNSPLVFCSSEAMGFKYLHISDRKWPVKNWLSLAPTLMNCWIYLDSDSDSCKTHTCPRGVLVLLKFYWAPDIVKFVLGRFSHFNIAITYSNSTFCGAWTPSFCEFTQNFSKTSTPQVQKLRSPVFHSDWFTCPVWVCLLSSEITHPRLWTCITMYFLTRGGGHPVVFLL